MKPLCVKIYTFLLLVVRKLIVKIFPFNPEERTLTVVNVSYKLAKILTVSRKSYRPIVALNKLLNGLNAPYPGYELVEERSLTLHCPH